MIDLQALPALPGRGSSDWVSGGREPAGPPLGVDQKKRSGPSENQARACARTRRQLAHTHRAPPETFQVTRRVRGLTGGPLQHQRLFSDLSLTPDQRLLCHFMANVLKNQ